MKKLSYLLSAGVLVAMLAVIGCSKDDGGGLTPVDAAGVNFEGTWAVDESIQNSVTFDNGTVQDRTADFNSFTLTITYNSGQGTGSYSTTGPNEANPWPQGGTWEFATDSPNANSFDVIRDPETNSEQSINVTISENNITLRFQYVEPTTGGRTNAVEGEWVFNLVQQ